MDFTILLFLVYFAMLFMKPKKTFLLNNPNSTVIYIVFEIEWHSNQKYNSNIFKALLILF